MASDFEIKLNHVTLDNAGIIEIWKSQGMQDALCSVVEEKAELANQAFAVMNIEPEVSPYVGGVDLADRTAIGYVTTHTELGRIDQARNQTLDALNH